MTLRPLSPTAAVAGQIDTEDLAAARGAGITRIINNRHDGERPDQPSSAEMEALVRAAGLDYVHVPIAGRPSEADARAVGALLADGTPSLLYCLSGLRSAAVWAMAVVGSGAVTADEARTAAAAAGYDLSGLPL